MRQFVDSIRGTYAQSASAHINYTTPSRSLTHRGSYLVSIEHFSPHWYQKSWYLFIKVLFCPSLIHRESDLVNSDQFSLSTNHTRQELFSKIHFCPSLI